MVVECNKRPLFAEEPTDGDIRRIVDILFRSKFVLEKENVNEEKFIFLANPYYKTKEFVNKHKFALLKILFEKHKIYHKTNDSRLILPKSIMDRTNVYLEMSCDIVQWFKEYYIETGDKNIIKVKDIYEKFVSDEDYYTNLTKQEKKKYGKIFFIDYFRTNVFLKNYFCDRSGGYKNVIKNWSIRPNIDD